MKRHHLRFLFLTLIIAATWSCSSASDDPAEPPLDPDQGKTYFFLEEGKYREYDVYEIRYFAVDMSDTNSFQVREVVGEPVEVPQAESAHLVYRYSRLDDDKEWELDSVWSARVERSAAVSTENNVQYVKMTFPSDTVKTWDRNLFNDREQTITRARTFNEPFTIGFNTFLNAMEVEISEEDDGVVTRDNRYEVFADSIGLVYKYFEVLTYCTRDCAVGDSIIQSGRFYTETLFAHGNLNDDE